MMYNSKFVVCVKSNGKILREFKDTCYVPFGSNYSILLKNLNSVRALASVSIDGTDVAEGNTFVVRPNSELEINRFIKNGNLKEGNSFKFIERTASVEQGRGIKSDDGIIRVQFQFEKVLTRSINDVYDQMDELKRKMDSMPQTTPIYVPSYRPSWVYYNSVCGSPTYDSAQINSVSMGMYDGAVAQAKCSASMDNATLSFCDSTPAYNKLRSMKTSVAQPNEVGITVPGAVSKQEFTIVDDFEVETEQHVIVLRLVGETTAGKAIKKVVDVKSKPKCVTCGRVNKATSKFCSDCGTSLEIV